MRPNQAAQSRLSPEARELLHSKTRAENDRIYQSLVNKGEMALAQDFKRNEQLRNAYNYVKQDSLKTRQSASPKKVHAKATSKVAQNMVSRKSAKKNELIQV